MGEDILHSKQDQAGVEGKSRSLKQVGIMIGNHLHRLNILLASIPIYLLHPLPHLLAIMMGRLCIALVLALRLDYLILPVRLNLEDQAVVWDRSRI